jgi:hypothetical protein
MIQIGSIFYTHLRGMLTGLLLRKTQHYPAKPSITIARDIQRSLASTRVRDASPAGKPAVC